MLILLILLPLFSTGILLCFSNYNGTKGAILISCLNIFLTFFIGILSFIFFALNGKICIITCNYWVNLFFFKLSWSFLFDNLTYIMLLVVLSISLIVHLYSTSYMETDPHLPRFLAYLSLFTFFMLILVTANNLLQLFLGWEGVGLCSYLLINFWYTRLQANKSALKALFVNRVGDIALLIALCVIYLATQSLEYSTIFLILLTKINYFFIFCNYKFYLIKFICFFLFIGAIGKSAQIGLHMWSPDAMEGPTPVSALIHAATMVTAGVFLVIRCSVLFELSQDILFFVIIIGASTAILASTMGLFQHDIKKIIAYSTCSQLGYMILVCGLSNYIIGLYHLTTHAFFKALLFLSAGAIIHAVSDEQDMRKFGGLKNLLPFTYSVMVIGSFALMGFPFLAGFYSKDIILELTYNSFRFNGISLQWIMSLATLLTVIYSTRVLYRIFLGLPNGNRKDYINISEASQIMVFLLGILAVGSIFLGYFFSEIFTGIGNSFFSFIIITYPINDVFFENEIMYWFWKNLPLLLSFGGFLIILSLYFFTKTRQELFYLKKNVYFFYLLGVKKWFFDILLNEFIIFDFIKKSYLFIFSVIDRGYVEFFGPTGILHGVRRLSIEVILEHNMYIRKYLKINLLFILYMFFYFF